MIPRPLHQNKSEFPEKVSKLTFFSSKNEYLIATTNCFVRSFFFFFFFTVFFTEADDSQDSRGREGTIFYSTLPLPPTHEHWDMYLQLCMWDEYHVFLIATLVFTRLLLDEIYHLIKLPFEWLIDDAMFVCLLDELILGFATSIWHWKPIDLNSHRLSPLYSQVC